MCVNANMNVRDFSSSAKLDAIVRNLEENNGRILCCICRKELHSVSEGHFDHIVPYSKGGKSVSDNCQILCVDCNLSKSNKMMYDFLFEEKARAFLEGESMPVMARESHASVASPMTKERFDEMIANFIGRKGDIHKVDFGREYNNLPPINYVRLFYGSLGELKKKFGINDLSSNWNRDTIKAALDSFVLKNGNITQKDMKKDNGLPSLPCVLAYYPEYKRFTDIKRFLCGLTVPERWTIEIAIESGRKFIKKHGRLTQKDLCVANGLPSNTTVDNLFGSINAYQEAIGSQVASRNEYITNEDIKCAVDDYFRNNKRIIESYKSFFSDFKYSSSTIRKRYGTVEDFFDEYGIKVLNHKKAKYTKQEVDKAISNWVKTGREIPSYKELSRLGLPSVSVILKFYEDWKEPFIFYKRVFEEFNR